jgi:hypothetical protein
MSSKITKKIALFFLSALLVSSFCYAYFVGAAATSPLTANLSEAHSSVYYGNENNFTATAEGGVPPYTYVWRVDNQSVKNGVSPYYSTNSLAVGSHHVYVQVNDASNNSATTNTVSFEVLPSPSSSGSNSPTQTAIHSSPIHPYYAVFAIILVAIIVGIVLLIIFRNKRLRK